jgi:hypothetical protein
MFLHLRFTVLTVCAASRQALLLASTSKVHSASIARQCKRLVINMRLGPYPLALLLLTESDGRKPGRYSSGRPNVHRQRRRPGKIWC